MFFYRLVRALTSRASHLFWRLEVHAPPGVTPDVPGPVIFVGNHPNGLIDPALVFILTSRQVTFLAKEPLFRMPLVGWILKGLRALPVYRKQDGAGATDKNEGTFVAATDALKAGGAIMLFPEGKSHSEPSLAEIKTGAARIALRAHDAGVPLKIVPVGLTYEEKNLFRSRVRIETGAPLEVDRFAVGTDATDDAKTQSVRRLSEAIADALRGLTLNLEAWEELPLLRTAEGIAAWSRGEAEGNSARLRDFARAVEWLRREDPSKLESLKERVHTFGRRLSLVAATPADLAAEYRPTSVLRFVLRNLAALLLGFPFFLLGVVLFVIPYYVPLLIVRATKPDLDVEATAKFGTTVFLAPLWWALLTALGGIFVGAWLAILVFVATPFLALYTRYFLERRAAAADDLRVFFSLGRRASLKRRLRNDAAELAGEFDSIALRVPVSR